jgi:hypothetical protein
MSNALTPVLPDPVPPPPPSTTATPSDIESVLRENYRLGLELLFDSQSSFVVTNGSDEHAALIFDLFFRKARGRVNIFCRNLKAKVFDQLFVIDAAKNALEKGVIITVVTQEPPESKKFIELTNTCPTLRIDVAKSDVAKNCKYNFSVLDGMALRFEPNREEVRAFASMYSPSQALQLEAIFDKIRITEDVPRCSAAPA